MMTHGLVWPQNNKVFGFYLPGSAGWLGMYTGLEAGTTNGLHGRRRYMLYK